MNAKNRYRDMDKWRKTKSKQRDRYYKKTVNAVNRMQRWSDEEVKLVLAHEITDTELSALIGRSVEAIQQKRGKIVRREQTI